MPTLDTTQALRSDYPPYLDTSADAGDAPAIKAALQQKETENWRELLDSTLLAWGAKPEILEDADEGISSPSRAIVSLGFQVAKALSKCGLPAPHRIVPDGDGGFVFKWRYGDTLATLEFAPEGTVEFVLYKSREVISSMPIPLPEFE